MFAKIFSSIFDSSIADNWHTRIVFQDMLVLADKNGIIEMTPTAIARRTNLPLEIIMEAITKLEAPDPASRTPDHEGRRLIRLDSHREWGWQIVNYIKYRESATKEMLRMAEADRKRAYRSKFHPGSPSPIPPTSKKDKEGEKQNSPVTCPGQSRTVPHLSNTDKQIKNDELKRVVSELKGLGSLRDHDRGSQDYKRHVELTGRQIELRKLLGVTA